jgi:hypothetical protein
LNIHIYGDYRVLQIIVINVEAKTMAFCSKCGKELTSDTKFCGGCGTEVTVEASTTLEKPKNAKKIINAAFWVVGAMSALVLAIVIGYDINANNESVIARRQLVVDAVQKFNKEIQTAKVYDEQSTNNVMVNPNSNAKRTLDQRLINPPGTIWDGCCRTDSYPIFFADGSYTDDGIEQKGSWYTIGDTLIRINEHGTGKTKYSVWTDRDGGTHLNMKDWTWTLQYANCPGDCLYIKQ